MAITLTRKVAETVKAMTKRGTVIFNDKLCDGTRSLKVWGWTEMEYGRAQAMLSEAGCQVELVRFTKRYSNREQIRLHVTEGA
jgi:hypothetical protein